jgi:hypothetical protein
MRNAHLQGARDRKQAVGLVARAVAAVKGLLDITGRQ